MTPSEQIKERIDIVEFISQYVRLQKAGANWKGLCPFHREKTPSFMVSQDRQIWRCFGCNEGGDIFRFLMKYESLEFIEALRVLAKRAGVELKQQDPRLKSQMDRLFAVCEKSSDFFAESLKKNASASAYLKKRGLKEEVIEKWRLGFAPPGFDALFNFLTAAGFSKEEIAAAGLVLKSIKKPGSYFDRFRGRIIFPISDNSGRIVAFTGRIFGREENDKEPKYLNSPETPIFNKRSILYGFSENKKEIREKGEAVLVEGQMDFLLGWQFGLKNIVASSGTALTEDQLKILRRLADKLIVAYDMDEAGRLAAERAADMAKGLDFWTGILSLPVGAKDLAEHLEKTKGDLSEWQAGIEETGQYYFRKAFAGLDKNGLEKKKQAVSFFLGKLEKIASPVEKAHWLSKAASKLDIRESVLLEELNRLAAAEKTPVYSASEARKEKDKEIKIFFRSRREVLSERLLALAAAKEDLKSLLPSAKDVLSIEFQELAEAILTDGDLSEEAKEKLGQLELLIDYEFTEEIDWPAEFNSVLLQLKKEILKEKIDQKNKEIKEAESSGNGESLKKALVEYNDLLSQISNF